MEAKKNINGSGSFQMPLHYPRYTKKDYQNMPEWQLDMLLAEYGLPRDGDLGSKREFAMGAFLWPEFDQENKHSSPSFCENDFKHDSSPGKMSKLAGFMFRVLGHA